MEQSRLSGLSDQPPVRYAAGAMPELWDAMEPLTLVIPTFNEAKTIGGVIREISAAYRLDIIVADGSATDGTQAVAQAAGARVMDVRRGYGRACALGAAAAHTASRAIAFMDGDGADRGDLIGEIARPVLDGTCDLVLASRTRGEREPGAMLWHQVFAGRVAGFGIGALCGVMYSDMCVFRAISRNALQRLGMQEMTYGWNIEMQQPRKSESPSICRRCAVRKVQNEVTHSQILPCQRSVCMGPFCV